VRPALRADDGMDLVEDHRGDPRQHPPTRPGAQHDVQALGRRDQNLRRPPSHPPALFGRGVAAPGQDADLGEIRARLPKIGFQFFERDGEIPPDVVVECLERRDVQDAGLSPAQAQVTS